MKLKQLKKDDERFGHKAGDIFIVEQADYDDDKYVGAKIRIELINNSFYKSELMPAQISDIEVLYTELLGEE